MSMNICGAPCCWGVDDVKNPNLPPWRKVLKEAGEAGYRAIELGPYGYLPIHVEEVSAELEKNGLSIVAGTIFDDLVDGRVRKARGGEFLPGRVEEPGPLLLRQPEEGFRRHALSSFQTMTSCHKVTGCHLL